MFIMISNVIIINIYNESGNHIPPLQIGENLDGCVGFASLCGRETHKNLAATKNDDTKMSVIAKGRLRVLEGETVERVRDIERDRKHCALFSYQRLAHLFRTSRASIFKKLKTNQPKSSNEESTSTSLPSALNVLLSQNSQSTKFPRF